MDVIDKIAALLAGYLVGMATGVWLVNLIDARLRKLRERSNDQAGM